MLNQISQLKKDKPQSATADSVYFPSELFFPSIKIFEHPLNENISILAKNLVLNFFRVIIFDKLKQFEKGALFRPGKGFSFFQVSLSLVFSLPNQSE